MSEPTQLKTQAAVFDALVYLASTAPDLPAAYATVSVSGHVELQLHGVQDLEAWREALAVDPGAVELTVRYDSSATMAFRAPLPGGVLARVYCPVGQLAAAAKAVAA